MVDEVKNLWKRRRWLVIASVVLVIASGGFAAVRMAAPSVSVPTAEVKRGEFVDYVQLRGETKALKAVTVTAPFSIGGDLQIIKLARNGSMVKKGDVIVQLDTTKLKQDLAQNQSVLKSAEAEIEQVRSQGRLTEEQDVTDLMKARYDVEEAKLDASKQEIVSRIEGEESRLKVADAEQKLREAEDKLKSDRASTAADVKGKQEKRDKALFDVREGERKIALMTLKAPSDGMVTLMHNWNSGGVFGGSAEFKEGDRAWPGAAIAELPDLSTLRVDARVGETDRSRLRVGQTATVRVDALPDREFTARLAQISALATLDFSSSWPFPRNFDLELGLDQSDSRLRPGMSATARVAVERLANSVLIPAEASFQKFGQNVAYVLRGSKFLERVIQVGRRGDGQLLVTSGLNPGERVALRDPTEKQ